MGPKNPNIKQDYVTIYYDLSRAIFGPGPEPISSYYIAGIFSDQVTHRKNPFPGYYIPYAATTLPDWAQKPLSDTKTPDLFMFRFEKSGFDYHEDDKYLAHLNGSGIAPGSGFESELGFGFEMKKMKKRVLRRAKSSSSNSLSSASSGCGSMMEWESVEENKLKGPMGFSLLVFFVLSLVKFFILPV